MLAEGQQRFAGIGDEAFVDVSDAWTSIKGDVLTTVNYYEYHAPRPQRVAARALAWRLMRNIPAGDTAVGPSRTAVPSAAPVSVAQALVERVRAEPFGDDNVAAAVGVHSRARASAPTRHRSRRARCARSRASSRRSGSCSIRRGLWHLRHRPGGGIAGEDLDPLVPEDPDLAPSSWIVGGYVAVGDTEGAAVARSLIGEQDWTQAESIVFPQLALALFTSDLARDRMAEAGIRSAAAPTGGRSWRSWAGCGPRRADPAAWHRTSSTAG